MTAATGDGAVRAASIPGSLVDACGQARIAVDTCLKSGKMRMFVEIDTSNGDATYTLLKNTLPVVRMVSPCLLRDDDAVVHVLLPDAGAAALLLRDWPDAPAQLAVAGLEGGIDTSVVSSGVLIVAPRASDVERLEAAVASADVAGAPVVVLCPDLVDMGVTGLSLNARQLRERLIDSFDSAYYLKTFPWGVILRAYPGTWGVWVDEPGSAVGFRLVKELEERPSNTQVEEILDKLDGGSAQQGGLQGMIGKLSRFLKVYSQG